MESNEEMKFPTFECMISNTVEDLDSDVEFFFWHKNYLAVELARLRNKDDPWAENYEKIMRYLSELASSIAQVTDPPSHEFLISLSLVEEVENDTVQRLIGSRNELVADLTEASIRVSEMIHWFVRLGKDPKFSRGFTFARYQGLPFLRLALVYRSIQLSRKN